jgi:hypothetical protein
MRRGPWPQGSGRSDQHDAERTQVEATRTSYRPKRITTLFVGESAPNSGKFFYYGNTAMSRHMREAMDAAGRAGKEDFLERFKAYGWYLDDLVLSPVNHLPRSQRMKVCRDAQQALALRIAKYQPSAIVSLLLGIQGIVDAAADDAGCAALRFAVPFPGNGQQVRFRKKMARILPQLPRL